MCQLAPGQVGATPFYTVILQGIYQSRKLLTPGIVEPEALVTTPRQCWLIFWKGIRYHFQRDSNRCNRIGIAIESRCGRELIGYLSNTNVLAMSTILRWSELLHIPTCHKSRICMIMAIRLEAWVVLGTMVQNGHVIYGANEISQRHSFQHVSLMMPESSENSQNTSDYFGEDDTNFLKALQSMTLPGDKPQNEHTQLTNHPNAIEDDYNEETHFLPAQSGLKRRFCDAELEQERDDAIYGASHFGQFGEYIKRKRAKLQIQNHELQNQTNANERKQPGLFQGIAIHVSSTDTQNLITPDNTL